MFFKLNFFERQVVNEIFNFQPKKTFFNHFVYFKVFDKHSEEIRLHFQNHVLLDDIFFNFKHFVNVYYKNINDMLNCPRNPCKHYLAKVYADYDINFEGAFYFFILDMVFEY